MKELYLNSLEGCQLTIKNPVQNSYLDGEAIIEFTAPSLRELSIDQLILEVLSYKPSKFSFFNFFKEFKYELNWKTTYILKGLQRKDTLSPFIVDSYHVTETYA